MNINVTAERVLPYVEKISSFRIHATVLHAFFSVSLLAFAVQGIPFLVVHAGTVMSSVQLGYWLTGGAAALFFATILWVLFNKN